MITGPRKGPSAAVQVARLKVPIAKCYPLAQAYKAHERISEGHVVGKMILSIHSPSSGETRRKLDPPAQQYRRCR